MKFHDYHIKEYTVSDRGETITFDLVFGYPNNETDRSIIKFTGVALYNFTHTCNAIITDIYEVAISEILQENRHSITEWNRMHGIEGFQENVEQYSKYLQSKGLTAWCIESAIGFYGFVIAKAVKNA